jgi:glutathione peroxidase
MLLEKYSPEFEVLAFPCNQFGGQAPLGSEGERAYAYKKFGIDTFPVFDTIEVNGKNAHPLYNFLKAAQPDSVPGSRFNLNADIEWNYAKFLVDSNGIPVKRYKSPFNPADGEADVRLVLAGKAPLPEECIMHPGRSVCKVEQYL